MSTGILRHKETLPPCLAAARNKCIRLNKEVLFNFEKDTLTLQTKPQAHFLHIYYIQTLFIWTT